MRATLLRTSPDLLIRADEAGRTVFGICCPFGQRARVDDGAGAYVEMFERGAFSRTLRQRGDRIRLHVMHDSGRRLPVGKPVELEERDEGLFGAFTVARTRDGDDVLTAVAEGLADSFSIGFEPLLHGTRKGSDGTTVRTEVILREVSVVHTPAYAGAVIAGVRSATPSLSVELARARLDLLKAT